MAEFNIGVSAAQRSVGAALGAVNAPREIGFIDRTAGLVSGLDTLQGRLESLSARIAGGSAALDNGNPTSSLGLGSQLSDAESKLRACLAVVDELSDRF